MVCPPSPPGRSALRRCLLIAPLLLAGCDLLGIETASQIHERKVAEGKAVGSACRHAGRAIEDCYTLNRKADKAAVFAGWKEMNDYMTENKIEVVAPTIPTPEALAAKPADDEEAAADTAADPHGQSGGTGKSAPKTAKSPKGG
jgi:hypothetical protein